MNKKKLYKELIDVYQLVDIFNKHIFEKEYESLGINDIHTLDYIGKTKDPNVTKISNYLHITRGGSTKITKKLMEKSLIESYSSEENKKEKYFKLTEEGRDIYSKHEKSHELAEEEDSKIFDQFNSDEKKVISKFLVALKDNLKRNTWEFKCFFLYKSLVSGGINWKNIYLYLWDL